MALSWNEIKDRAVAFSKEWEGTFNEDGDAYRMEDLFEWNKNYTAGLVEVEKKSKTKKKA
jgi:hypothetical protein